MHTHACMHTCVYVHACTQSHPCMHTLTHIPCARAHMHTLCTRPCVHACAHVCMHARACMCARTHTHTHTAPESGGRRTQERGGRPAPPDHEVSVRPSLCPPPSKDSSDPGRGSLWVNAAAGQAVRAPGTLSGASGLHTPRSAEGKLRPREVGALLRPHSQAQRASPHANTGGLRSAAPRAQGPPVQLQRGRTVPRESALWDRLCPACR